MAGTKTSQSKKRLRAPKGMRDLLPTERIYWDRVERVVCDSARMFGYNRLETPILEDEELFIKGTGADTDIVEKEMFKLTTKGRDKLCLRPEMTPPVMRSYFENGFANLPSPVQLYSLGPVFRYSRPQKGRYRQFYQANFEAIGEQDPVVDANLVQLFLVIARKLGLKKLMVHINSIGCPKCRPNYRKVLANFYRNKKANLCADCRRRAKRNLLRLLDCKAEQCIRTAEEAPQIIDYLCSECNSHFKLFLEYLDSLDAFYVLDPYLVRGLDYYTKTVFEVFLESEGENRQAALMGGGRYDGLAKLLGGKDIPAVGFAMGIDRIVNLMQEMEIKVASPKLPAVFLVQLGPLGRRKSLKLFEDLHSAGIDTASSFSKNTIKVQLRIADKLQSRFALILGQKEALDDSVIIRDMRSGSQEVVPLNKVITKIKKRLARARRK